MGLAILTILFFFSILIFLTVHAIKEYKEEKEKEKQLLAEKKAYEEWLNSTKCCICDKHSYGKYFCEDCLNRIPVLKKELPFAKIKNFETVSSFHQELIDNIIFSENKSEQEFNSIRLIAVSEILKEKYFVSDARNKAKTFLEKIAESDHTPNEEIIQKYASTQRGSESEEPENSSEQDQFTNTDFRQKNKKPYRCNDGDYVRSKSEREIDDFLYANRIWHVYEPEYVCHNKKKYYPDFYLPDYGLYIEYFGRTDEEYIEKKKKKIEAFSSEPNIKFEYLEHTDDVNITEKLTELCRKHDIPLK
ncbi:MAG: hypothetical protein E7679_04735 [Ruminococcaceae bacterium]|nr:hypothetical protein [Oscillospiraceae bacterium]